ncbi:MAG: flagellar basal body rod protein FlgB [Deltaproteobacteria bacterium]|nr:flagellar basal body rod protein FlgB [Deltaproteobacteria bacterium]
MIFLEALDRAVAPAVSGLDVRSRRQAALAANIANADTPGYKTVDASFAGLLGSALAALPLAATDGRHLQGTAASSAGDALVLAGGTPRRDGNDVNVDREMAKLARNQIEYQFLARALSRKFNKLKEAITGRASA